MSSVVISGNTSGAITLSAPDVAGTNTITLPASTGYLFVTPTAGTLGVSSGGTGLSDTGTAYGVLAAGTTTTGAFQNIGTGTANQVLTSNGPGVLPSFKTAAAGGFSNMTVFTSPGTFTTPASTTQLKVTVVGGGGAGRGNGGGGGAGGGAIYVGPVTASTGYPVTVGAAGPYNFGTGVGSPGGTSSFGVLASATGGSYPPTPASTPGSGGSGSAGTLQFRGGPGGFSFTATSQYGGYGGNSIFGGGAAITVGGGGNAGGNYGGGGAGGSNGDGNSGGTGVVIVEY